MLNPVFDAMSYAYAAQSILEPMAGFSVVCNIVLSPYLLNEKFSTAELFRLFESRIFVEYAIFAFFLLWRQGSRLSCIDTASVALVAESGSIWYRPETYVIYVAALSSAGGGIYVLDLGLSEHDALYLISVMNTRWQLIVYPFSIVTTVGGIIVLSEKHTEHCDPRILGARIIGA
ncbi:hypothetical protein PsorP6_003813 [Peronosclerospora sorghi]|uniref:Uncharacterized protein n=1 Tax=Peronosclerospora sorghi TaxID=230839 RepID=A0ACC0VJG5_9STRA|nr:hypothetical protein PsorP6_003813 [Peronosclerospora sorghi]